MSEKIQGDEDEVSRAIEIAKNYIRKLYSAEYIKNLGLEEVEEQDGHIWDITLGFSRPWDVDVPLFAPAIAVAQAQVNPRIRTYKVVRVDTGSNKVLWVRNRDV